MCVNSIGQCADWTFPIQLTFRNFSGLFGVVFLCNRSNANEVCRGAIRKSKVAIISILNLWILMIWKSHFSVMYFHYNAESYLVDAFVAIGATWVVYRIAKYIDNCRLLNLIGRETLLILCCHEIIRQLISDLAFNGIRFGIYRGAVVLIMGTILLSGIAIALKQVIVKYRIKQN